MAVQLGAPYQAQMAAPLMQSMTADLEAIPGIVVRQETQMAEAVLQSIGVPYESKNKYKISELPAGKRVARDHDQDDVWNPTGQELQALPELFFVQEESSLFCRIALTCLGCLNLRPLTLHFYEHGTERFIIERPCRIGGCCCSPLEMTLKQQSTTLGMVKEDFEPYCDKCCKGCFACTNYTKVYDNTSGKMVHKYTLRANLACCGRTNNCCGATCCKNNLIMDILDAQDTLVSTIQKTFAPSGKCGACCRMMYYYNNYIVEFPPNSTAAERALITTALFQQEYMSFENKGGDNDNSASSLAG